MNHETIIEQVSSHLGELVRLEAVEEDNFKDDISDSTKKFRVNVSTGPGFFLIMSGAGNPQLMSRAVDNIKKISTQLSPKLSEYILQPVLAGTDQGLTYAMWPAKRPFPLEGRVKRFIARRRYAGGVLDWSDAVTHETLRDGSSSTFLSNLQTIYDEEEFPLPMRKAALLAQERLSSNVWSPKHCIHHGDFWIGNVLLPTSSDRPQFYVIDWAGMQTDGYPFLDLARMLISMRCPPRVCRDRIKKMCGNVECDDQDIIPYVLSAVGHIGQNLEQFPPDLYRAMAVEVYNFMKLYASRPHI
jgi:hypothetical protein